MALALVAIGASGAPAQQEIPERAALQREFESLFQRTLDDPADLDAAFRYAEVATRLGDYEAAISALERMLFVNPDLPRVRLELGVLYFRLGSFVAARRYFEQASEAPNAPPEVKQRVAGYLAQIDRLESPHHFAGQILMGAQHQSNANVGPASARVRAVGLDATLSSEFVKKADENLFATGTFAYSYDLGNQSRDAIEATATAYQSKYFRVHRLDLGVLEGTVGPRLGIGPSDSGVSVRPYLIANWIELGRNPFFHTYGVGGEAAWTIGGWMLIRPAYEHRVKNYSDARDRPNSREFTGYDDIVSLTASVAIGPSQVLSLNLTGIREDTRFAFDSNTEYGGSLSYTPFTSQPENPWG